jgi:hypothetical protein
MGPHAVAAASLFCVSIASMTGAVSYLEQVAPWSKRGRLRREGRLAS